MILNIWNTLIMLELQSMKPREWDLLLVLAS